MSPTRPSIKVTDIAEYIRYKSCDRRFKLKFNNYEIAKQVPFYELIFSTSLDPVLEEEGHRREKEWETSLQKNGLINLTQDNQNSNKATDWNNFVQEFKKLSFDKKLMDEKFPFMEI